MLDGPQGKAQSVVRIVCVKIFIFTYACVKTQMQNEEHGLKLTAGDLVGPRDDSRPVAFLFGCSFGLDRNRRRNLCW